MSVWSACRVLWCDVVSVLCGNSVYVSKDFFSHVVVLCFCSVLYSCGLSERCFCGLIYLVEHAACQYACLVEHAVCGLLCLVELPSKALACETVDC